MQEQNHVMAEATKSSRQTLDIEIRQAHVEKWKQSGLSMREYCHQQNLATSSFCGWVKKFVNPRHEFKPIAIKPSDQLAENLTGMVEIITDGLIKVRLVNISNAVLVVDIIKGLIKCI